MKTYTTRLIALLLGLMVLSNLHATEEFRYEANWDSIRSHYEIPEWFRDAKFGIFLHWGPYAVPAYSSEKFPKGIYNEKWSKGGMKPYTYHREHYGEPSEFGYKDFIPDFKAEHFDAGEWVDVFKAAGAKYVVPVAEHHDGFAMYASQHTRWNVANMGPKKDTMKMLRDACEKEGLKFGVSSHFALNRMYYEKTDPSWDTNDPQYADLYWKPIEADSLPSQEFLDDWWNRTTDIIDNYQPDLLWFDFGLDKPGWESMHKPILAYYYNKGLDWGKEVVFQDKNMNKTKRVDGKFYSDPSVKSFPEDLIVLDIERGRMSDINPSPWQTDTAVGKISWGYIDNEDYKTSGYLLDELIDIVSKNGCLLLNVGPKADGTLGSDNERILREVGAWLKVNGEAIYGTRPWKIYGEGPTHVEAGHHSEKRNKEHVAEDFRFTQKNGILYATSLAWPENGEFTIKSLAKGNKLEARAVKSVFFVSGGQPVDFEQTPAGLKIKVSGSQPCDAAYVFRVKFE